MKIAMIAPVKFPDEAREALKNQIDQITSPGTEVTLFEMEVNSFSSFADLESLDSAAAKLALDAERNGFDIIVMGGA